MLQALDAPRHLRPARAILRTADLSAPPPPRKVRVDFNPPQHKFIKDDATPYLAFVGGLGSGKTFALSWWLVFEQYFQRGTGTIGGIFANTYDQLEKVTLRGVWEAYEAMGFVYGDDYVYGERPPRSWGNYRSRFKRHNGIISHRTLGQVITRSLDNPHAIRGIEIGYAGQDEMRDSDITAFNVLIGRIRCPMARRWRYRGATTPNGFDWVFETFVDKKDKKTGLKDEKFGLVRARTQDNFAISAEYAEGMAGAYDPKQYRQEVLGEFLSVTSGAVYHQFDRTTHVRPDIKPDPQGDWQVCFDFNRNPMTCVICQTRPTDANATDWAVYCLDEVRIFEATTDQAAREAIDKIFAMCGGKPPAHVDIYGDPAGNSGSTRSTLSDYDLICGEFERRLKNRYGRRWAYAHPPVSDRINAVNARLRNHKGIARMFLHPRCEHLMKDLEQVTYIKGSSTVSKKGDAALLTHLSDALGYYIHSRFPVRGINGGGGARLMIG